METRFNFQINSDKYRYWEDVPVISTILPDRFSAVLIARKVAKLFKADVRMSEGKEAMKSSGSYFTFQEQD
ncbi:addiction module toxin RelE [Sphingobacterium detergens]|uniref:Uncharacterized protein n=1 Tax=Sphingobacterium detergens TaxID=1145106 RepID=A0A420ARN7_SPHD1|nr:addiction module toxin RelE [Sphingobacterium detergens]RKE47144.1 hypothetical protein DFQ12_4305 [Sphingobacterium detergens]